MLKSRRRRRRSDSVNSASGAPSPLLLALIEITYGTDIAHNK